MEGHISAMFKSRRNVFLYSWNNSTNIKKTEYSQFNKLIIRPFMPQMGNHSTRAADSRVPYPLEGEIGSCPSQRASSTQV